MRAYLPVSGEGRTMEGFYPVFLKVAGKKAVVVGGGAVAARKAATLAQSGALVTIVSPELGPESGRLVADGLVRHDKKKYAQDDLSGASIAIAATDDPAVNIAVCADAERQGIPANSARPPDAGSFIVPSSIRRGDLSIAISTGGGCPALSKRLRTELERFIGDGYGPFLEFLEEARAELKARVLSESGRAAALTALVESGLVEAFRDGPVEAALAEARWMLESMIKPAGE